MAAFDAFEPDVDALRRFDRPVYFALGGRGNPDLYARMAEPLARVFPDFTLEVFAERYHFDPPHRIEPARLATSLRAFWMRTESNGKYLKKRRRTGCWGFAGDIGRLGR